MMTFFDGLHFFQQGHLLFPTGPTLLKVRLPLRSAFLNRLAMEFPVLDDLLRHLRHRPIE